MAHDGKPNATTAHARIVEAATALQFTTEFLWHVASDIEALARGKADVEAWEVYEYGDRLRYLARLYEKQQWDLHRVADDVEPPCAIAAD